MDLSPERASPRVSVIIPTRDRPEMVCAAVASVQAQTVSDIEILVLIDGPDAKTEAAIGAILDPRLRVTVNPTSDGPGAARNRGLDAARGTFVAFLDDDDVWEPNKLAEQIAMAEFSTRTIVTCLSRVETPRGNYVWPRRIYDGSEPIDEWLFLRRSWTMGEGFLQASTLFARREDAARVRFGEGMHEDWEFVIRAAKEAGLRLATVPLPLCIHRYEQTRPSQSRISRWRQSLEWLDGLGPLVTRRAYAGCCLTAIANHAAAERSADGFKTLLVAAFRRGHPTLRGLALFAAIWLLTPEIRRSIRRLLQSGGKDVGADVKPGKIVMARGDS